MCRIFFAASSPGVCLPKRVFRIARDFGNLAAEGKALSGNGHRDGWGYFGYSISEADQSGILDFRIRSLVSADKDPAYLNAVGQSKKNLLELFYLI
ncbi:MAG: hypothetical protein HQ564_08350 [Candidatus Saganbacteria bacterium]|nr:hypothetical protein [Candidatus Saganbacteria bacterium]